MFIEIYKVRNVFSLFSNIFTWFNCIFRFFKQLCYFMDELVIVIVLVLFE